MNDTNTINIFGERSICMSICILKLSLLRFFPSMIMFVHCNLQSPKTMTQFQCYVYFVRYLSNGFLFLKKLPFAMKNEIAFIVINLSHDPNEI